MATRANEASSGNSPFFEFINQPLKRTTDKPKVRKPRTERDAAPLMTLVPPAVLAAPEAAVVDTADLPHWAMTPPIQAFILYRDKNGKRQKCHVTPHLDLGPQDAELTHAVAEIQRDGGRDLVMEIIAVHTGLCVSRWMLA